MVQVKAYQLLAIREALVIGDQQEAYHILRMMADEDCRHSLERGNHWHEWERIAETEQRTPAPTEPHAYAPSIMHMGDCSVCGHLQGDAIHSPFRPADAPAVGQEKP